MLGALKRFWGWQYGKLTYFGVAMWVLPYASPDLFAMIDSVFNMGHWLWERVSLAVVAVGVTRKINRAVYKK